LITKGRSAIGNKECGNGVVIDHGGGWQTQLCHFKLGSVRVKPGDKVRSGQPIAQVGMSGLAEFPHVHLSVRRAGAKIDPNHDTLIGGTACGARSANTLWRKPPIYIDTAIVDVGFLEAAPKNPQRADADPPATGRKDAPALVGWMIVMGPRKGDDIHVKITTPDGRMLAENRAVHPKDQAQMTLFAGKRLTARTWTLGTYNVTATVGRNGKRVAQSQSLLTVK
jgi:murein DD-endopeptidase MepM/ murein hydrolase activator NlpD